MDFKSEGFVHTDEKEHYSKKIEFKIEEKYRSLKFDFFSSGKELFFHVKDPSGILRLQHQSKPEPTSVLLSSVESESGIGTVPGKIGKGVWEIKVFAYAPRFNRMWGKVSFEVGVKGHTGPLPEGVSLTAPAMGKSWIDSNALQGGELVLRDFDAETGEKNAFDGVESRQWVSGDFHVHTMLTDGSASPGELLEEASSKKMDFFFITEHNILTTGFAEKKGVSVFPSYEVTTVAGHFNALGLRYAPEWLLEKGPAPAWADLSALVADFRRKGVLISINHPFFDPWQWQYSELPLSWIDSIEVVTDPWDRRTDSVNEKAFRLFDLLWKNSYRPAGVGGSDTHTRFSDSQLGQPVTRVYAAKGSMKSHLAAVRAKHAMVLPEGGGRFSYSGKNGEILPGTAFDKDDEAEITCTLEIPVAAPPLLLELVENGELSKSVRCEPGEAEAVKWKWKKNADMLRCNLRHTEGNLAGFINPLYRNIDRKCLIKTWGDAVEKLA